jgi:DNA-binding response OmpR family regulator
MTRKLVFVPGFIGTNTWIFVMTAKPTLFVIDDDQDILELYEGCLSDAFEVHLFASGRQALESGHSSKWPDSMLVDLVMPEWNGIQTITECRSKGFQGPFVICSGMADKKFALQALSMKAFALLEKPFIGQELINIMKHCVTESKLIGISHRMMSLNAELAQNAWDMSSLYEKRLAEAENLMFNVEMGRDQQSNFLDHQSYYEIFARVSQRIDVLRFEISQLQNEQERLLAWRDLN